MKETDLRLLLSTEDHVIAEDIQRILEESGIYTLASSDHPASSYMSAYFGLAPTQGITLQISKEDFPHALKLLLDSPYQDLFAETLNADPANE